MLFWKSPIPSPCPAPLPTHSHFLALALGHIKFEDQGASLPNDGLLGRLLLQMQLETQALRVLVSSYCCSTYRVADPFSSLGTFRLSCRRMRIDPFLSPCTKVKFKWIKELHIKPLYGSPGIHPIISLQTMTPLHTLASVCWKDPDIAVSCETRLGPSQHISGCSQSAIGWIRGPPMEELEKVSKELKRSVTL